MAERTLTQRDLNRALLARQLLLARVHLPLPRALEQMGGIQNQYAPNAYIRLFSCLEGFRREDLARALERRTVVNATLGATARTSLPDRRALARAGERRLRRCSRPSRPPLSRRVRSRAAD